MSHRSIPEIRFGIREDDGFGFDAGDMTVATAPLMATQEDTVDGKVSYGWVFKLESPIPEVMAWGGHKDPPIHAWGRYKTSNIDIYRVAEDQSTGLQSKEKWFTINPESDQISCWKLAEERKNLFDVSDNEPIPEEDQRTAVHYDEASGKVRVEIRTLSPEAEERERQRTHQELERLRAKYAPDLETGLHLLGLIRHSINELS